jgi:hypothetical protein
VTESALSIAFFDRDHGLHGTARSGATILFEGSESSVLARGPEVERTDAGWSARLEGSFSLELEPLQDGAVVDGVTAHLCEVTGTVGSTKVRCLGTVGSTDTAPAWDELDALRSISAVFDRDHAFLAIARRPRGAPGHGHEEVAGWLLHDGRPLPIADVRISTTYDGVGRQRSAGLELWVEGEDFPRRLSGTVAAGSSLQLERVDVHCAIFRWRMEDRDGVGAYELWTRRKREAA